jgi:hypothetical protein
MSLQALLAKDFRSIAFVVHVAETFNHYQAIWRLLGEDSFDIVIHGTDEERAQSRALAKSLGYRWFESFSILNSGHRYDIVVSTLSMYDHGDKPLIKALGNIQVRFMYALGAAKHNFASWNSHYDLILCFGPWEPKRLKACSDAVTFQMGYPRYDDYFRKPELLGVCPPGLTLDPEKKTVLWLPSWKELSSISCFADAMAALCGDYNVIVKTHPLSVEAEPHVLAILDRYEFTAVIVTVYDNLNLFRCADYVVSDYGGTPFGALYLDKNLLLLNVPGAEQSDLVGEDSPDVLLRKEIVNVDETERWNLPALLADDALWAAQTKARQHLRQQYFVNSYGFSAELAVMALCNIETLLKQG